MSENTPTDSSTKPASILFVDPDWEDFAYLTEITNDLNFELIWSRSASEALVHLNKDSIDIVISDWSIRTEEGHRLTSLIKSTPELSTIYTFLIGDRQDVSDIVRAMRKGADDVMIKPIDRDIFLARIDVALRQRKILAMQSMSHHEQGIMETLTTVAHEINNPLFAVLGNIDLLYDELEEEIAKPDNVFLKECIQTINEQGERMAEVVRKLQAITKPKMQPYRKDQRMLDLATPTGESAVFLEDTDELITPTHKKNLKHEEGS